MTDDGRELPTLEPTEAVAAESRETFERDRAGETGEKLLAAVREKGTVHAGTVPEDGGGEGRDPEWAVRPGEGAVSGDFPGAAPGPRRRARVTPEMLLLNAERIEQIAAELDGPDGCEDAIGRLRACAGDLRDGVRESD